MRKQIIAEVFCSQYQAESFTEIYCRRSLFISVFRIGVIIPIAFCLKLAIAIRVHGSCLLSSALHFTNRLEIQEYAQRKETEIEIERNVKAIDFGNDCLRPEGGRQRECESRKRCDVAFETGQAENTKQAATTECAEKRAAGMGSGRNVPDWNLPKPVEDKRVERVAGWM
jgi:hypothetical protein